MVCSYPPPTLAACFIILVLLTVSCMALIQIPHLQIADTLHRKNALGAYIYIQLADDTGDFIETSQQVKDIIGCTDGEPPQRVIHHQGKYESSIIEAGLHTWYYFSCTEAVLPDHKQRWEQTANRTVTASPLNEHTRLTASIHGVHKMVGRVYHQLAYSIRFSIQHLEFDLHIQQDFVPNDMYYVFQRFSQINIMNVHEAWDIEKGNQDVVVAVIDSGMRRTHEDLRNVSWVNSEEICDNSIDDDGNGFIDDCFGYDFVLDSPPVKSDIHGTHTAGTIGAMSNNGVGVSGIAGGEIAKQRPGVRIMNLVIFSSGATSNAASANAIIYAVNNGATFSSNSWGFKRPHAWSHIIYDAIKYSAARDHLQIFSIGNEGRGLPYYPASHRETVAVAATDGRGYRAGFSNYGPTINISAPGIGIYSTCDGGDYSYCSLSGTSMACPAVSGVIALGFSIYPNATSAQILDCLYTTATDIQNLNGDNLMGAGMVNALEFVKCVQSLIPVLSPTPTALPIRTASPSPTPTNTASPSPTYSSSPTASPTHTASPSPTPSSSPTASPTPTASPIPIPSPFPTPSASPSASSFPSPEERDPNPEEYVPSTPTPNPESDNMEKLSVHFKAILTNTDCDSFVADFDKAAYEHRLAITFEFISAAVVNMTCVANIRRKLLQESLVRVIFHGYARTPEVYQAQIHLEALLDNIGQEFGYRDSVVVSDTTEILQPYFNTTGCSCRKVTTPLCLKEISHDSGSDSSLCVIKTECSNYRCDVQLFDSTCKFRSGFSLTAMDIEPIEEFSCTRTPGSHVKVESAM